MNELSLADMVGGLPPEEPQRRSRRGSERRKKKRRRRTWLLILVALVVVGGAVGGAWVGLRPMISNLNKPNDYPGPGTGRVEVKIPEGASGTAIGQVLQDKGVVLTVKGFISAFGENPDAAGIQPGTYVLKSGMSSADAVTALLDSANRLLAKVTLKEGVRAADVPALVAKQCATPPAQCTLTEADLKKALATPAALGLPPQAEGLVEGWLFPATYDVEPDTTAEGLLRKMVQRTTGELDQLGVPAAERHDLVVKASLVQAEAKLPQDFPKIARVLDNRLKIGMKLRLDTTVHYATKKFTVATTIADTRVNSPYNTYQVPGLPKGAIGNPGTQAMQAVLQPAAGDWLYFVAVNPDTGLTKYATDEKGFAVIKGEYDRWAATHPGR